MTQEINGIYETMLSAEPVDGTLMNFGIITDMRPPRVPVVLVQASNQDEAEGSRPDYWGWYDFAKKDFTMVYHSRFLLNMCFMNGIEHSERARTGKAYRLLVWKVGQPRA